jgi:hypothetical protein
MLGLGTASHKWCKAVLARLRDVPAKSGQEAPQWQNFVTAHPSLQFACGAGEYSVRINSCVRYFVQIGIHFTRFIVSLPVPLNVPLNSWDI